MDPDELQAKNDALRTEYHVCKRKLESKCEALLILSKELGQCRTERDQFKLMAEQLRERYQDLKRQVNGLNPISAANSLDPRFYSDMASQSLARLLCETKEQNKSLQFESDDQKQKLQDAQGDIKLLREQIARQRVGTTDEGISTRHFPAYEREDLVRQLEAAREQFGDVENAIKRLDRIPHLPTTTSGLCCELKKYLQLERDLQQVLDEKEEQVTERDAYRTKYERLNQELNYILRGDEKRIVDIDALSMENKYLHDRMKQMEEEKSIAMATVSKYKSILERKKNKGILKLGQNRSGGGVVISQKQVQQMLENQSSQLSHSPQAVHDLQALASALLDTVNDKNLAISHQRKTNKILGNRVNELEKKLKTLEVSGLWSIPANLSGLEKLRADCEEVKSMIPRQMSETSEASHLEDMKIAESLEDYSSDVHSLTPHSSCSTSPSHTANHVTCNSSGISLEDLDLLPTKDDSGKKKSSSGRTVKMDSVGGHGDTADLDKMVKCEQVFQTSVSTAGDNGTTDNSGTVTTQDDDELTVSESPHSENSNKDMVEILESLIEEAASKVQAQSALAHTSMTAQQHSEHVLTYTDSSQTELSDLTSPTSVGIEMGSMDTATSTPESRSCSSPLLTDQQNDSDQSDSSSNVTTPLSV